MILMVRILCGFNTLDFHGLFHYVVQLHLHAVHFPHLLPILCIAFPTIPKLLQLYICGITVYGIFLTFLSFVPGMIQLVELLDKNVSIRN
jgi:hypothetical protein